VEIQKSGYLAFPELWLAYPVAAKEAECHLPHILQTRWPSIEINFENSVLDRVFFLDCEVLLILMGLQAVAGPSLAISQGLIPQAVSLCRRTNAACFTGLDITKSHSKELFLGVIKPFAYATHHRNFVEIESDIAEIQLFLCGVSGHMILGGYPVVGGNPIEYVNSCSRIKESKDMS